MARNSDSQADVTVGLPEGLHMRPLSVLSKAAQGYTAEIHIRKGGQIADAKRPLELMTLAAECGEMLSIEADGHDAEAAISHLVSLFASNFADDAE